MVVDSKCGCLFLRRLMGYVESDSSLNGWAIRVWYCCPKCGREFSMDEVKARREFEEELTGAA
jgi:hypothetical protein